VDLKGYKINVVYDKPQNTKIHEFCVVYYMKFMSEKQLLKKIGFTAKYGNWNGIR